MKILDFGLAKAAEAPDSSANPTASPTFSMTEKGMILGTAAYMSPEQARGEPVDKRTDIWAFGVILYELLAGRMLFGDSRNVSDVLAAVLTREPDFAALPKGTPQRVRRILELSLRKDPKQRMRDIGDVRLLLDEPEPEAPAPPVPAARWPWGAAFAVLAILAAFAWYRWPAERASGPFQRMQITKLTDSGKATVAAISPDGKYVLHTVTDEGKSSLWLLHAVTGSNVQILPPAQGALSNLNFSRDGNSLYYVFDSGQTPPAMYTMPVLGGNARALVAFGGRPLLGGDAQATSSIAVAALSPDEKRLAFVRGAGSSKVTAYSSSTWTAVAKGNWRPGGSRIFSAALRGPRTERQSPMALAHTVADWQPAWRSFRWKAAPESKSSRTLDTTPGRCVGCRMVMALLPPPTRSSLCFKSGTFPIQEASREASPAT